MAVGETLKKYVGAAGDALVYAWNRLRTGEEERPPVGAKDEYKPTAAAAVGGISTGTLLLLGLLWMMMKRR